jgi:class 3 adenylate cyclase
MSADENMPFPSVASEAIVVVDLVESTAASNLFGWYAVGRSLMRDLRTLITEVGRTRGLQCVKSTGDGYLFTFANSTAAEMAALNAIEGCFEMLDLISRRNATLPEERAINLRFAVHFGEVDVIANDREGPHVSYAFRVEGISRSSLAVALNSIPPEQLPLSNYILCSEEVAGILDRRGNRWSTSSLGLLKLKGFSGWREAFRVLPNVASSAYSTGTDPTV